MRLLYRENGIIKLTDDLPVARDTRYAILSHTWLPAGEEVLFHELQEAKHKPGYKKIEFLVDQAARDGLRFSWADTCCIDKRNSSELSEALISMFRWYARAAVCYVYLADVPEQRLGQSRWFTRGWTLQELVAPKTIKFFDDDRRLIGDNVTLATELSEITKIEGDFEDASLEERFSWSLQRETTRAEDISYCLMGLLEVSMVPLYGEDGPRARQRLLDEVERQHGRVVGDKIRTLAEKAYIKSEQVPKVTLDEILKSLRFEGMLARLDNISDPYPQTCVWLLHHDDYQRWLSRDFRFLWIKGKPGAGKSTLMKYAMRSCARCISFFFHARGGDLEKTVLGMYRSVLWQLLSDLPDKGPRTEKALALIRAVTAVQPHRWTINELRNVLRTLVRDLEDHLTLFIDALDECDTADVQQMVWYFSDLSQLTQNFSICFASRYYPGMIVDGSVELRLDQQRQHAKDLEAFIKGRLRIKESIQAQVIAKANGIFFWAVLVVPIVLREISKGNIHRLQKVVETLPSGLIELLQDLLKDADDEVPVALQLISLALRPLGAKEFYCAIRIAIDKPENIIEDALDVDCLGDDDLERFVSNCTRGLGEVIRSTEPYDNREYDHSDNVRENKHTGYGRQKVQFIHESVQDFLLKHGGLQGLQSNVFSIQQAHDVMKDICYECMKGHHALRTQAPAWARPQWTAPFTRVYETFRDYASYYCLQHAHLAADIPQEMFIRGVIKFCDRSSRSYIFTRLIELKSMKLIRIAATAGCRLDESSLLRAIELEDGELVTYLLQLMDDISLVDVAPSLPAIDDCGIIWQETATTNSTTRFYTDMCEALSMREAATLPSAWAQSANNATPAELAGDSPVIWIPGLYSDLKVAILMRKAATGPSAFAEAANNAAQADHWNTWTPWFYSDLREAVVRREAATEPSAWARSPNNAILAELAGDTTWPKSEQVRPD